MRYTFDSASADNKMIFTQKIRNAIRFSITTHEVYQKQKRKGKDVAYITHPLTVGLILAKAGATEDIIIAGILHDTVEDSVPDKKVTPEMLTERFGKNVSDLVMSVTEINRNQTWEERKAEALEHIKSFSRESILLKGADVLANTSEILEDYKRDGDKVFARFAAPKSRIIEHYITAIDLMTKRWKANPLAQDLQANRVELKKIAETH